MTWLLSLPAAATAQTTYSISELPGTNCAVFGMNDDGDVAGQCDAIAAAWQNGVATSLGKLPKGTFSAPGTWDIGPSRPVVWRDGGVFELQSLLDPASGEGWTITSVSGINNLGQITGSGLHNGLPTSFVMTPTAP